MAHILSHEDLWSELKLTYSDGWQTVELHDAHTMSRVPRSEHDDTGVFKTHSSHPRGRVRPYIEGVRYEPAHKGRKAHMRPVAKPRSVLAPVPDQGTPTNREGRGAKRRVRTASAAPKARVSAMPTHRPLVMSEAKNLRDVCHPSLCPFFFPTNETRSVSEEVDMAGGEGIS